MKTNIALFCMLLFSMRTVCQQNWQLKKEQDGIKVYTAGMEGSKLKQVKVTCTVNATVAGLAALLMDAPAHEQWVYHTKQSYTMRQFDAQHQLYYSESSLPWPMANRDVVVDMRMRQDPVTKVLEIDARSQAGAEPEHKGVVRVPTTAVHWTVTPAGDHRLQIEYTAQADPGGSVPAWITNAFITRGPLESFLALRRLVSSPKYAQQQVAFIQQ